MFLEPSKLELGRYSGKGASLASLATCPSPRHQPPVWALAVSTGLSGEGSEGSPVGGQRTERHEDHDSGEEAVPGNHRSYRKWEDRGQQGAPGMGTGCGCLHGLFPLVTVA